MTGVAAVVYDMKNMNVALPLLLLALAGCGSMGLDQNEIFDGAGRIEVFPDGQVEFDDRPVGRGSSVDFTVNSIGDIPITVEAVVIEEDDPDVFFVGDPPFPMRLDPGGSVTFRVNFEPQHTGTVRGVLVLEMDDGSSVERNLVGSGCRDNNGDGACG